MPDDRPTPTAPPTATRESIADLLGRILAEHWLRRRGTEPCRARPEPTRRRAPTARPTRPVE